MPFCWIALKLKKSQKTNFRIVCKNWHEVSEIEMKQMQFLRWNTYDHISSGIFELLKKFLGHVSCLFVEFYLFISDRFENNLEISIFEWANILGE